MACNKETVHFEVVMNQPLSRVWIALAKEGHRTLTAALPEIYSSIECQEGHWGEKGATILFKYPAGLYEFSYSKEILEEVDHDKHFMKCKLVEGGVLGKYFREQIRSATFLPGPDANSCLVRLSIEYENIGKHNFYETIKADMIRTMKAVDAYINANPDYLCVSN